jgi:hypothetical protein
MSSLAENKKLNSAESAKLKSVHYQWLSRPGAAPAIYLITGAFLTISDWRSPNIKTTQASG